MKIVSLTIFQPSSVERDFLKCVNRGLSKFDENRINSVFSRFESDYDVSRDEIFDNPDLFSKTLRSIFRFGSPSVERAIISELLTEFSLPARQYKDLADAVSEIAKVQATRN
jgi:hypothetical protein